MSSRRFIRNIVRSSLVLGAVALASGAWAMAEGLPQPLPPQPLSTALEHFARYTGFQVVYRTELTEGLQSQGAEAGLSAEQALRAILRDTGLTFHFVNERMVALTSTRAKRAAVNDSVTAAEAGSDNATTGVELEEIVVTAQKRVERLIDVPQSVTVLSGDALTRSGVTQFRDYANTIPGLTFTTQGAGRTQITLRGVTTGADISSAVALYIDEVPYGSSTAFAGGAFTAVDVGLLDLDRIEVLRGPQGTLYGASAMGGLLKYVSKQPDLTGFAGEVQTGVATTRQGGTSFNVAASANVPLMTDRLAFRVSGFESRDGGYIDNIALGENDVNRSDIYGGRLDVLFAATDALSLRVTGFLQNIERDGNGSADYTFAGAPVSGDLEQRRLVPEPADQRLRVVSATINYDLGASTLTSVSSFQTVRTQLVTDLSPLYVPSLVGRGRFYSAVQYIPNYSTDKFVQELRWASANGQPLEWIVGGFYTNEDSSQDDDLVLRDLAGQIVPNDVLVLSAPSRYEEIAAFGDVTWHLSSAFDVTAGLRYARPQLEFTQNIFSAVNFGTSQPKRESTEDVLTWLGNARYHINDRSTAYFRYATGYRPGGPNYVLTNPATGLPVGPPEFEADRMKSYELGIKLESPERRFGVDVAVYHSEWDNMQLATSRDGFAVRVNAPGGATIRGAELSLSARPLAGFTATGAFAWQDAQMAKADTLLGAAKGEALPNVPDFTGSATAEYLFSEEGWRPSLGTTLRYVSERNSGFNNGTGSRRQYRFPDYTLVDLRAGVRFGSIDTQLYVRNVFDERGQLSAFTNYGVPYVSTVQPRTIGVSAVASF